MTVTGTLEGGVALNTATTVTVSVGGGTATEGTDYATVADLTLTIAAGSPTGTATFDLDPTDDDVGRGQRDGGGLGHRAPGERADGRCGATLTLTDDDRGVDTSETVTVSVAAAIR